MKKGFIFSILTLFLCLLIGTATAQTDTVTVTETTPGTRTWHAPVGAWKITKLEAWGGGGGGGNATYKLGTARAGSGGGGGAYTVYETDFNIIPGFAVNYAVASSVSSATNGNTSTVTCTGVSLTANGGKKGANDSGAAGAGGTASGGTTNTTGTPGVKSNSGSQAGAGGAGANGGAGGTAGSGSDGGKGIAPGGGGGGGQRGKYALSKDGGSGARGQIRITYETLTLQVTRNLNYDAAPDGGTFTILYYDKYTVADLQAPTRDGYTFLGWTTDPAGQNYLNTDSVCKRTDNYTIYAQWLYMGELTGSTTITPCANFGIENQTPAFTINGVAFTYKWYLYISGVTAPIASYDATPESPTLPSGVFAQKTANPDTYTVKRVAKIGSREYPLAGEYTVGVSYNPGSIEMVDTIIVPGSPIKITGSPVENSVYFWTCNGNRIEGSEQNLTITANALCSGTHIYKRFAKVTDCPMDSIASGNTYTVEVAEVNPGKIEATTIYTCHNGAWKVKNVTKASITPAGTIEYQWSYTDESGTERFITNNKDSIDNSDFDISELNGKYILKRYAMVACSDWKVSEDSAIIYVAGLPDIYEAPTANYDQFCVGGQVVVDPSDDWKLESLFGDYAFPTEYRWMVSMNDGSAQLASQHNTLNQVLWAAGTYVIRAELIYFNQEECKVATEQVSVKAVSDPTLGKPMLSSKDICPNSTVELTAGSITGGIASGEGATYTYTWELKVGDQTEWDTISANEATYDTYHNNVINASNFFVTGNLKYRTFVSNDRGCDAYSSDTVLHVIEVPVPIVRGDTVCPKAEGYIAFKATTTVPNSSLRWYENSTTTEYSSETPTVSMTNELDTTMYVAQFDSSNNCVSARLPDAIYITYSAHLQYVDASGDLEQEVCQNDSIRDIQFNHGGDCEPQITFDPEWPEGVTRDNSEGLTSITGKPTEAGIYTYHVALLPNEQTKCAAPNSYDGKIIVNPVYKVTDVQSLCADSSYIVSDSKGPVDTFSTSGVHEINLQSVNGCDSIVTLYLYVQEWNQFGYEDASLIAGWTNFNTISAPMNADHGNHMSGSNITYEGSWVNSNSNSKGNLSTSEATSSFITAAGYSLGLVNGSGSTTNNGNSIILKTSTEGYGNVNFSMDFASGRLKYAGVWSNNDIAFSNYVIEISTDGINYTTINSHSLVHNNAAYTYGSCSQMLTDAANNSSNLYIKITFNGAAKSNFAFTSEQYFLVDNICISGTKAIEDLTVALDGTDQKQAENWCSSDTLVLKATAPYTRTIGDTTPVIYKWEKIIDNHSNALSETSNVLTDDDLNFEHAQYVVSVGTGSCITSDTFNLSVKSVAQHTDIKRSQTICASEVGRGKFVFHDNVSDQDVPGAFISYPDDETLKVPGLHEGCYLNIPNDGCDSIIWLDLTVNRAFDTTIVDSICVGDNYNKYGFDITPIETGDIYDTKTYTCTTGCDSVYNLKLHVSSIDYILSEEHNVSLAAWDMNTGTNNFKPTCGVRTSDAKFSVHNTLAEFTNVSGHAPTADYCYTAGESNGALQWANLFSSCSGLGVTPTYTDFNGVYFEIKLNPKNYNNLRLKFDYKRENNNDGAAFNNVNYAYKFAANGEYMNLGSKLIEGTDWSEVDFDLSSIASLNEDELYLKLEFTGGRAGTPKSCGIVSGSKYIPSYITVDNLMIMADRPALTTLDGSAQTCSNTEICEGEGVTFACQRDNNYLKFYLVNEKTSEETPFNGNTELTVYPDTTTTYTIKAVDTITYCDSSWTYEVLVIKAPTITYVRGSRDHGLCGNAQIDNEIVVKNAASYTFTWLTDGNVTPEGVNFSDNGEGTITMGGTLTDVPSARYAVKALADNRCPVASLQKTGVITVRKQPKWNITLGADTVCQSTEMQFQIDTNDLNFVLVPEDQRVLWSTVDGPIASSTDTSIYTLDYEADETKHSKMHYLTVNQNGCTTLDSVNIVVYDFSNDDLLCSDASYLMHYGDHFLHADSLIAPPLMHNGDTVPANMIDTVLYRRTEAEEWHQPTDSVFAPSIDNLNTIIYWQVTDICGRVHECSQNITLVLPSCGDDHTVTDVDGNVYGTVRIGFNCWMKENLRTTHYADGTNVPDFRAYQGNDAYPDSAQNAQLFGLLYSWNATVNNTVAENAGEMVQGICPDGWVVPNAAQFEKMMSIDVKELRTAEYWMLHDGTNTTGFTMLPAGYYNNVNDRCEYLLGNTFFWTSDLSTDSEVRTFEADCHCYRWQEVHNTKSAGLSVRCVQVEEVPVVEDISE